jgi:hypothetical protein
VYKLYVLILCLVCFPVLPLQVLKPPSPHQNLSSIFLH